MTDREIIEKILEEQVRPNLSEHGGDILIDDIRDGVVYVKMLGHCSGCPSAKYTLESLVKEEVLKHTDRVTDVRLHEEVSQDLYDFAKAILSGEKKV